ncbi:restriction endonuclease subunit S [Sulfitobacter pontiacus]|uniref:restriction endonuclease subunit S n=1 Tax=Sulfitobacter pontiacus TaxID=60137 RepID=UPI0030EE968D
MNAERLLEIYEQISEAPDAIARLRRFVLELAVRGKLVEQDAGDESSHVLLRKIEAEKERQAKRGEIRKRDAKPVAMLSPPFELPASWSWTAVGNSFVYDAGAKTDPKNLDANLWLLELEDVEKETGRLLQKLQVADRESKSTKSEFRSGDVLYGKLRPYLNKVIVADEAGYSTTEIVAIRPYLPLCSAYAAIAFRRPDFVEYVGHKGQGTKMPRLRTEDAVVAPFPLPPLAEQHRIVVKVDELMALCDRLEEARKTREETRDKLTAASFARLTAPDTTAEDFPTHARFALEALPSLTTRPNQIKTLRQTILNLAVRGKLVEQDPAAETGQELLARMRNRAEILRKEAGVRKKKTVAPLDGIDDMGLPDKWSAEAFANIIDPRATISYGVLVPGPDVEDGVPFVRAQDLMLSGHPDKPGKTIANDIECKYARTRLEGGEILLCVVGSIGKLGVAPKKWAGANIARAVARIAPMEEISREFTLLFLRSDMAQTYFNEATRTLAQPTLNVGLIEKLPFPIPPLAEQHRIVAKADALMALCDWLETALTTTDTTRTRLLEALLHEALTPTSAVLEAAE